MKSLLISFVLIAAFSVAGNLPISAQSPEQLYQKGLMKEEGEGALQEAIELYSQITDNTDADQSLRAKALLHIGMCYERMGTQEAVRAYQRLVNSFPTQTNEVAIARERLNRLLLAAENVSVTAPVPKFSKIHIPSELSWNAVTSPDGQQLLLVYDEKLWSMPLSGNLAIDIAGKPEQLGTDGIKVIWAGLTWSADGNRIAFNEDNASYTQDVPKDEIKNQNIYIIPSGGGNPQKITENYCGPRAVNYRMSLSPDGRFLAFSSVNEHNETHIYSISLDGSVRRLLVEMQAREPVYSPDGNTIAFVEDKEGGIGGGGLWTIPAEGGDPTLVADAGFATSPVWSPDASKIAFIDDLDDQKIFIIPVDKDGRAAGKKVAIDTPEGINGVQLLTGWSQSNKIGMIFSRVQYGIYTMPSEGGQALMVFNGSAMQPRWSPDGNQIFFSKDADENSEGWNDRKLEVIPADGGEGSNILSVHTDQIGFLPYGMGIRVSPNEDKIVFSGKKIDTDTVYIQNFPTTQIWAVNSRGKAMTKITDPPVPYSDDSPCLSPDGKSVAFIRSEFKENRMNKYGEMGIYTVSISGGNPRLLTLEPEAFIYSINWSPDGKWIAFIKGDKQSNDPGSSTMNIVNVNTGESREVGEVDWFTVHTELAWSPDCGRIAYNDREGKVIKVMSVEDGSVRDIETSLVDARIFHLDWSPDGKRFAFVGYQGGVPEFWFLEDFLPLESLSGQSGPAMAEEPEGIRIKKVWESPLLDYLGTVSYDGKYRACVDWGVGDVAIHNLETDEIHKLTHEASLGENTHFAENPAISKDGKRIAYSWWNPYNTNDLWLINVDDLSKEHLYKKEGEELYPAAWLSDNELVATRYFPDARKSQIIICNVQDKTLRVKKDFDRIDGPVATACSPDEKYIAYSYHNEKDNENFDINLLVADGNEDIPLIRHPSNDKVIGWIPGKNVFLFLSDRSGTWDLWGVSINDRNAVGPAKLIYTDLGDVSPMGFTSDGTCYFGFNRRNFYSSITPLNKETGTIELGSGETMEGSNYGMTWSPDGRYLAYLKIGESFTMSIQDHQTGKVTDLNNMEILPLSYCWAPDGKSMLAVGLNMNKRGVEGYKGELLMIDLETDQTDEVFQLSDYEYNVPEDDAFPLSNMEWYPDGESFYYLFFKDRLVRHDLDSGEDKVLLKSDNFTRTVLDLSPDGTQLLFGLEYPGEEVSRLFTIPPEGGKMSEICETQEAGSFANAFWSPDGRYIYFVEILQSMQTNLWRVSPSGGDLEKVWSSENRVDIFGIHPNGNQVALSARERKTEVRAIENLDNEIDTIFDE